MTIRSRFSRTYAALVAAWVVVGSLLLTYPGTTAGAITYGYGSYGRCQYGSCNIGLSSSSTLSLNVTPSGASTMCTVASDSVTVTTSASTGYTLKLNDGDTSSQLTRSGGGTINPITGSAASPATLTPDSWGYRVDGTAGFGAGPTSAVSNGFTPAQTFAPVPISTATPDTLTTSSTAVTTGATTSVWYGLCVSTATGSGSYSDSVVYTATIN